MSTKYLTQATVNRLVRLQKNAIASGIAYRAECKAGRREMLAEVPLIVIQQYDDKPATAKENLAALDACKALLIEDFVNGKPDEVMPGMNFDHESGNALDNTVMLFWNPASDKPRLANACGMDYSAMRKHFDKSGSIVKLANAWLKLSEDKRFNRTSKSNNGTSDPEHVKATFKAIRELGLTKKEAEAFLKAGLEAVEAIRKAS